MPDSEVANITTQTHRNSPPPPDDAPDAPPPPPPPKKSWWRSNNDDQLDQWVSDKLAEQFRRSMLIDFKSIPPPDPSDTVHAELYRQGLAMLEKDGFCWQNGYEAQQIKVRLVSDSNIEVELARVMKYAQKFGIDVTDIASLLTPPDQDADEQEIATRYSQIRAHLSYLISDIQWEEQKKFARRALRAEYVKSVCKTTWIVGTLFFSALAWTVLMSRDGFREGLFGLLPFYGETTTTAAQAATDGAGTQAAEAGNKKFDLFRYPGLLLAIASGVLGAWFSMLVSIDQRLSGLSLEELRVARKKDSLWARLIFGGAAAVIFYFLLRSKMINGTVLPDLNGIGFVEPVFLPATESDGVTNTSEAIVGAAELIPSIQLCLLVVWCVIVGFSEKLIPAALTRNADKTAQPAQT